MENFKRLSLQKSHRPRDVRQIDFKMLQNFICSRVDKNFGWTLDLKWEASPIARVVTDLDFQIESDFRTPEASGPC